MKTDRKPQRQKARVQRIQDLRRSNAAQPIPSATEYKRKDKYGIKWEEEPPEDDNPYLWS